MSTAAPRQSDYAPRLSGGMDRSAEDFSGPCPKGCSRRSPATRARMSSRGADPEGCAYFFTDELELPRGAVQAHQPQCGVSHSYPQRRKGTCLLRVVHTTTTKEKATRLFSSSRVVSVRRLPHHPAHAPPARPRCVRRRGHHSRPSGPLHVRGPRRATRPDPRTLDAVPRLRRSGPVAGAPRRLSAATISASRHWK